MCVCHAALNTKMITGDERLSEAANNTTMALFGQSGAGKTTCSATVDGTSRWAARRSP